MTPRSTNASRCFLAALFLLSACAPASFPTPLEEAQADRLTSYEEMHAFLDALEAGTDGFVKEVVGNSVEGRDLALLRFGAHGGADDRLRVLFFSQQHGNEPSGKEAAIALARDIATGAFAAFLGQVDFYLIPQVNPDGSEALRRHNADGMDLNRDHLTLTTSEVQAVHQVFQEVMPHVALDVHEYGITSSAWVDQGIRKNFGQQIGAQSNANMPLELREFAWNRMIPEMKAALAGRDVDLNRYLVSGGPDARFRFSTTAINDGRNSTGIYNAFTFIFEGRNGLSVEENIRERARQQLETMKAFLTFMSENSAYVKEMVERHQSALAEGRASSEVALVMDYVPDPERPTLPVSVVGVETGEVETLLIEDYHPTVETTVSVARPTGYVVPAELTEVIQVLERHRIPMVTVTEPFQAELESYGITGVEATHNEDKDFLAVEVRERRHAAEIPAGSILVPVDGLQANLVVILLEPQSQWGLAPLPGFVSMLEVGRDYPIRRVLSPLD